MKNKLMTMILAAVMVAPVLAAGNARAEQYTIDAVHSTIGFAVKHMVVATTRGQFTDYEGTVTYEEGNPEVFAADITIQTQSIDTRNEKRDEHLRSEDFFAAEQYPTITFQGKSLVDNSGAMEIVGDLTIKDVTKEISIPVEIAGPITGMGGGKVIGITGETEINRQDFNVSWSKNLDQGGLVVDDTVRIIVELEAHAE